MRDLPDLLDALEQLIPKHSKLSSKVSAASVGWHIGHSLLVLTRISKAIIHSTPSDEKEPFSLKRYVVLTSGRMPRGRGRAPEAVKPVGEPTAEELPELFQQARTLLVDLKNAPKESNFMHPVFGRLQKKAGLRFMQIHTNHHLLIIQDIIKHAD